MELFEFVLVLLACVIASSVLDQIIPRMSLPLLQIGVGLVLAIIIPGLSEAHLEAELFLVLFIAPLLFREARETSRLQLWDNKWSVLSMAIALVVVSVLAAGFIFNLIIPSVPLAAAFACAAALGPTDAAAVSALGTTVDLNDRQKILLSGEALINDASGVVSFQFAIAAAVTGAFSFAEAIGSFALLFFGGIAIGAVMGFVAKIGMNYLRSKGYVSTTVHVLYEVLSPFLFFLVAEEFHLSGILAVVAAGIVMQETSIHLISPDEARQEMVSNSFWEVIVFLINGILFVMLGMQLPKVLRADSMEGVSLGLIIGAVLAITATIVIMRFLWLLVMENIHKGKSSIARRAMVTTIAGPKGAVTLSIIMTIPLVVEGGAPFPHRDLIIFVTSAVILCTLLLANFALPKLAPRQVDEGDEGVLKQARIKVLEGVIEQLRKQMDEVPDADFIPAARLSLMRYRVRLLRQRFEIDEDAGGEMHALMHEVLDVQQKRADEIQSGAYETSIKERMPYYEILPAIRASIGYFNGAENVGARFETRKGRFLHRFMKMRRQDYTDEQAARVYYDTCIFAIDMERVAMEFLERVRKESTGRRAEMAGMLLEEHTASIQSLWGRINYGQDIPMPEDMDLEHGFHEAMPEGMQANTQDQFSKAWHFMDETDAYVLSLELEQINKLRSTGEINESAARTLREEVYLMQTAYI